MRSLSLRIFLWFWVAMTVVAALLLITSPLLTRSRPRLEGWQHNAERALSMRMEAAVHQLQRSDIESVLRQRGGPGRPGWMRHLELYAFDADGNELAGQPASRATRRLASQVLETREQKQERHGSLHLLARPTTDRQGRQLVLVAGFHRPPKLIDLLEPEVLAPRMLALLVVVGALSLGLARHLTSPLKALRLATRRLTGGDLSARVGAPISRRHDEVGQLARDFDIMASRVQGLISSQQRLLRDVSHELRSPLARQAVALGLARQQVGGEAQQWLDRIEREGTRLNALIEQLLTLTRLESGSDEEPQEVELARVIEEVVADARLEAAAGNRRVELSQSEPCQLQGRPQLLRSAVDNLVRNALRYTAEQTAVAVSLTRHGSGDGPVAVIQVRDHGPGIPAELLADNLIFEPFVRVDDARDPEAGGSGLGLAIAARAVKVHGGTIAAANDPDGGLVMTIRLPLLA